MNLIWRGINLGQKVLHIGSGNIIGKRRAIMKSVPTVDTIISNSLPPTVNEEFCLLY